MSSDECLRSDQSLQLMNNKGGGTDPILHSDTHFLHLLHLIHLLHLLHLIHLLHLTHLTHLLHLLHLTHLIHLISHPTLPDRVNLTLVFIMRSLPGRREHTYISF